MTGFDGVTCTSSAANVVDVQQTCSLIAMAPGSATVDVQLGSHANTLTVIVEEPVKRGDFDGNGEVDTDDLNWLTDFVKLGVTPVVGDSRDLNGDGRVNGEDVGFLRSLCTVEPCRAVSDTSAPATAIIVSPFANAAGWQLRTRRSR